MEEQSHNKTTPTEIKKEFDEDITIQLDSIKEEVLDEGEKNCEVLRGKQPTLVENQQQDQQQQQLEICEIKSELIIDHQINDNDQPEKVNIAEQIPSWSTNFDYPGYPGFIEAIRQAKGKNKSHDVSYQMLFSCFSESVKRQHDIHLNEWWNYCLVGQKNPLETDLSVFIGYLEKKLDAGALCDGLKSISSSVCLIASDKMANQIHSLSFLFLEFAKYSPTNNTDGYKTPKLSCQNNSVKLSSHSKTKKQDGSNISSVQIENVKKANLSQVIDISDSHPGNQSPSTSLKKPTDVLNNNMPTTSKNKSVLLQKAMDNSQVIIPLMESPSTKPPIVKKSTLPEIIDLSDDDSDTESPSTSLQKDVLNINEQSNYKENCVFLKKVIDKSQLTTPLMESSTLTTKPPAILLHSQKKISENNVNEEPVTETINGSELLMQQAQLINKPKNNTINQQITIETTNPQGVLFQLNTSVLEWANKALEQNEVETGGNLQSGILADTVHREQQQLTSANNYKAIESPRKILTPPIKPAIPATLPVLIQCQINKGALECLSQELKETKIETTENLQSELLLGNKIGKQQQQQSTLSAANNNQENNLLTNNFAPSTCRLKSSVTFKLQTSSMETLIPAIQSPTLSANLSAHHDTQLNTSALECSSKALEQNKVESGASLQSGLLLVDTVHKEPQQKDQPLANNNQAIDPPTITLTPEIKPLTPEKLPVHHDTQPLTRSEINARVLKRLSKRIKQKKMKKTANLQTKLRLGNATPKNQQQPQKARSYLQKKSPVQSVNKNQSPKNTVEKRQQEQPQKAQSYLKNSNKKDSKSISDLSDTSIHSDNSLDEIGPTNKTESYAFLQKDIDDPQKAIVQDQVEGNTVKILVVEPKGGQRLITFNLPNEKCTVNDLLEQAGVPFNGSTAVSLVEDPILKINYIVESETGTIVDSTETSDDNNELLNDNNELSDEKCLQDDYDDTNIHATSTVNIEEPKYIDGKLAVCNKCGLTSMDFNRCYHCKKKIQNNPKTVSYTCQLAHKKDMMVSIGEYYKSVKVNNDIKNNSTRLNLHTTSMDSNSSSSNLNKKQPTIGNSNSNDINEDMIYYLAKELIKKSNCVKLSSNNQDTNANNKKNRKSNDRTDEFMNNNSTQVSTIISIEKPKYIDGKLAVCDHCGSSSIDFNRCYYCKKKIQNNTKTKLDKGQPSQRRHMLLSIDEFYKNLFL